MISRHALTITVIAVIVLTSIITYIQIPFAHGKRQTSFLQDIANGLLPLPDIPSSSSYRGPDNSNVYPNAAGGGNNKIPDGSITTSKLADGAVTNSKLAPDAVTNDKIKDGEVNADDIADDAIIGSKISDGSINQNHISESFMKKIILADDSDGNSKGWNPNGVNGRFDIIDPNVSSNSIVVVNTLNANTECSAFDVKDGVFSVHCGGSLPANGGELHYLIINAP